MFTKAVGGVPRDVIIYHRYIPRSTEIRFRRLGGILPWRVLHPQAVRGRWTNVRGLKFYMIAW